MATIPASLTGEIPVIGFIAHLDTSPDFPGENVKPQVIYRYDGKKIRLHPGKQIILDPDEFPELLKYTGQTLITTDGTTLLGADDKAGIAEIVTAAEFLMVHPEYPHGQIRICFTPDEETGRGTHHFSTSKFGATFAYTVDGGELGELEYENFNAARALVRIEGKPIHPGEAKGRMVNALMVAHKLTSMLPPSERPENTEGTEGYFHLLKMSGNVGYAEMEYNIRDHDMKKFIRRKELMAAIVAEINSGYSYKPVTLEMKDQYYNMHEKIAQSMFVVDLARNAMILAGVEPKIVPVRGGTDGALLSWMGLPCPNIFTGGHNFHGPTEFIPVESMMKAVEVILRICSLVAEIPHT
jgi:tripeptide aminopeptidase